MAMSPSTPTTAAERGAAQRKPLHVCAGALIDDAGRVLITRRPEGVHQGGLWEFPGGKVEPHEAPLAALRRELTEELGIALQDARPLIQVHHDYGDRAVWLDVWRVASWRGAPHGREGQALRWAAPHHLDARRFPRADVPVIAALRLPPVYLITPEPGADHRAFLAALEASLRGGMELVQLRAKTLAPNAYGALAREALALCQAHGARLLLNAEPSLAMALGAQGVHLSAARLLSVHHRPLDVRYWVGASCHHAGELAHACRIGVDFAVLSPVHATPSHPGARPLGWARFQALVGTATVPVYALGGLGPADLAAAWVHGGQGIAAIRALWRRGSGQ